MSCPCPLKHYPSLEASHVVLAARTQHRLGRGRRLKPENRDMLSDFSESRLECLLTAFLLRHEERNVASLPYFGDREIHCSKPCVKAADSVAASVASACLRMTPLFCSTLMRNLYFHELVHYPLKHLQQGVFCCYKIQ